MPIIGFFTNVVLDTMQNMINLCIKDGVEYGTILCINKEGDINTTDICKGGMAGCNINHLMCKNGDRRLGGFHTHPRNIFPKPSVVDLFALESGDSIIECIGNIGKDNEPEMSCYLMRDNLSEDEIEDKYNLLDTLFKLENLLDKLDKEESKDILEIFKTYERLNSELLSKYYKNFDPIKDRIIEKDHSDK
jgi:hypothetical protein